MARPRPRLRGWHTRWTGIVRLAFVAIAAVLSTEPSSTTTIWNGRDNFFKAVSRRSRSCGRSFSSLKAGRTTAIWSTVRGMGRGGGDIFVKWGSHQAALGNGITFEGTAGEWA